MGFEFYDFKQNEGFTPSETLILLIYSFQVITNIRSSNPQILHLHFRLKSAYKPEFHHYSSFL